MDAILKHLPPILYYPAWFCIFNISWTFIIGELTGNVSQVDRVWTFLPPIYTAFYAFYPLFHFASPVIQANGVSSRACLMFFLQVIWMLRLSYNTWRRGLFSFSEEDYRWNIFRQKVPAWLFSLFNLGFVAIIQNILLALLGLPAHDALLQAHIPLGTSDYILAGLALLVISLEFIADNQQYSYQTFKRSGVINQNEWPGARIQWTEEDKKRGFVTRGLWAWSRHPNFALEQSFWWITAFFPILGSGKLPALPVDQITPIIPIIPPIALSFLFIASTTFTEYISTSKYPKEYKAYQARVGMFSPTTTLFKGIWLSITGKKAEVEAIVYNRKSKKMD